MARLGNWIEPFPEGIYVKPADAWVDPSQPKERALITHGHADHARGGHGAVWATPETLAIMDVRYGQQSANPVAYGETIQLGEVEVGFVPAGHVLARRRSARLQRRRVWVRDYSAAPNRPARRSSSCRATSSYTEATFGLPYYATRHGAEIGRCCMAAA